MSDFKNQQYTNKSKIIFVAAKPSLNTKDVFAFCKLNHDDDNNEIEEPNIEHQAFLSIISLHQDLK